MFSEHYIKIKTYKFEFIMCFVVYSVVSLKSLTPMHQKEKEEEETLNLVAT